VSWIVGNAPGPPELMAPLKLLLLVLESMLFEGPATLMSVEPPPPVYGTRERLSSGPISAVDEVRARPNCGWLGSWMVSLSDP
jgi:hypothetical protein